MIDPATYDKFYAASARARHGGLVLVEVLDTEQLLLTKQRGLELQLSTLTGIYRALDEVGVARLLGPEESTRGSTPEAAFRATLAYMNRYYDALKEGKL